MKKFSEFRNKLIADQAKRYSYISSIILSTIVLIILWVLFWPKIGVAIGILAILFTPISLVVFYAFAHCIFDIDTKSRRENFEVAKQRVILSYNLTVESYAQVKYNFSEAIKNDSERDMLEKLLAHSAYNFYVKLNDKDEIELIVKDKDQNLVYTDTFTNFIYLENYFEKID